MNNTIKNVTAAALAAELGWLVYELRWMLFALVCLIVADLIIGTWCSIRRKEDVRFSRALNRTLAKAVGYVCYVLVGGAIGMAVSPLEVSPQKVAAAIGSLLLMMEFSSVVGHVAWLHGWRVNLKGLLVAWLRHKSEAVADAVDDNISDNKECETGKKSSNG